MVCILAFRQLNQFKVYSSHIMVFYAEARIFELHLNASFKWTGKLTHTLSPKAKRPPRRSHVPSTMQTRLRPGRSPRSRSHIPPGPPRTGVSWFSAPGWEPDQTLKVEGGGREKNNMKTLTVNRFILHWHWSPPPYLPSSALWRVFNPVPGNGASQWQPGLSSHIMHIKNTHIKNTLLTCMLQLRVVFSGAHSSLYLPLPESVSPVRLFSI